MAKKYMALVLISIITVAIIISIVVALNKPIKVGVEFNLSGDYAFMGISENKILHFLLNNYFKNLNLELKVVDDKSNSVGAKKAIDELNKWGAQVIIGGAISKVGVPASEYCTKLKIPFLATTSTSASLFNKRDYCFTSDYSNGFIAMATGKMLQNENTEGIIIICSESNKAYSIDLANRIKKYVKFYRILTISGKTVNEQTMNQIYETIQKSKINSILFVTDSRTTAIIAQKLRDKVNDIKFYGTGWNSDENLIKFGGKSIEGFKSISTYPKIPNDKMESIENKYLSTYNENISNFFVFVYNNLVVLQNAIESGAKNRVGFYKYFSTPRYYDGIDGKFYMNKFGDPQRNYLYLLYVQDKRWKQSIFILNK